MNLKKLHFYKILVILVNYNCTGCNPQKIGKVILTNSSFGFNTTLHTLNRNETSVSISCKDNDEFKINVNCHGNLG